MSYEIKNTAQTHQVPKSDEFIKLCEWLDDQLSTRVYQTDPVNSGDCEFIRVFTDGKDYDLLIKVADYFVKHGGWHYTARYGDELRFFYKVG